jgi:hexokinase
VLSSAEDGSGVGAALIAALTIKRIKEGNLAGIKNTQHYEETGIKDGEAKKQN